MLRLRKRQIAYLRVGENPYLWQRSEGAKTLRDA